ncbi:hypothetical protein Q8A64_01090 [Oxalobacteraceae bacterium R-40]|uniref:Uncharacterized protein n=1 Tax=Keguizhuia sedimenti TaxID=3064264 RepID=A0ABU1BJ19_9BURK|nr:hypothetical protein [Oxalobacteraceae bacterium R-40]
MSAGIALTCQMISANRQEKAIMGGFGSGYGKRSKGTTNDMLALDVRRLQREGLLTPGQWLSRKWLCNGEEVGSIYIRTEADCIVLIYQSRTNDGNWQRKEYPVHLEWTDCNLGGQRVWFRCPAQGCKRRAAILFGGSVFACRHCHKLVYRCQREAHDYRTGRRADKIRGQLGWGAGILNGNGGKPKGMHWKTFWRLKAKHDAFAGKVMEGIIQRLGVSDHHATTPKKL